MNNRLETLLAEKGHLLADGATGTNFFEMGLGPGDPPEMWNLDQPEKVTKLHQDFVDAGSDIILTNSFGGTRHRLKLHNMQDRVFELNKAAAALARKVADGAGRTVIVAGSVGPTGELFEPMGALTHEDAVSSFSDQIAGLKAGGADVVWIETMSSMEEIECAAEAAIENDMPYVYTASFDTAGRTMMGVKPADLPGAVAEQKQQPVAVGSNCGVGASDLLVTTLAMTDARPDAVVVAKANAGIPVLHGEHVHYSGTPELMADYVKLALDSGARIVGGCCGNSPAHVKAMRDAMDGYKRGARPTVDEIVSKLGALVSPPNENAGERRRGGRRGR
ncbi:MAG: betaine--homocysteine S-methyltransferase [Rhodobiaceae bacterium]|nr:betaine--homocysteine S-methyltransferase [Rhodobiaceae bacterium]MCC0054654.1 betaine--homocysteine S-methyltransferase [Rhodobiaceae bacterium]